MKTERAATRLFSMDLMRVLACLLVIHQHASECFYVGEIFETDATYVNDHNTFLIGIVTSLGRVCVPLFVMISGYFLLPMRDEAGVFFRKRTTRVVYPFLFWCVAYAVYYVFTRGDSMGTMWRNIACTFVNFGTEVGHLWYVYMLVGLYLIVPILSPWLKTCSKKMLQGYLWLWVLSGFIPYIHKYCTVLLWGECFWNVTPMLYYFTGFAGYFVLGYYFKRFGALGVKTSLALVAVGYAVTAYLFCSRMGIATTEADLELSWNYYTTNVAMMSAGMFSLIAHISCTGENWFTRFVGDYARQSYGVYLCHIMVLAAVYKAVEHVHDSVLVELPLIVIPTFLLSYVLVRLLSRIPYSKYWLG